jgi:hypothetical protein
VARDESNELVIEQRLVDPGPPGTQMTSSGGQRSKVTVGTIVNPVSLVTRRIDSAAR